MTGAGLRNLFLQAVLAPGMALRSGFVGAAFLQGGAGMELAPGEHCHHLVGDSGHLVRFGLNWQPPSLIKMICWNRLNLKNQLYLSMTEKKTWSPSVLLLGSFHNKFLDANLLICGVSWGQIQIWSFKRYLFSNFIWIQWDFCCRRWQNSCLINTIFSAADYQSVRALHGPNLSPLPICDESLEWTLKFIKCR